MKYRRNVNNNLMFFNDSDSLIHSSFIVSGLKCIHTIDKLGVENTELFNTSYNFDDDFINNVLIPYLNDFCFNRKIKSVEMLPCLNNSTLYMISFFDNYNNVISINNISKKLAREIRRKVNICVYDDNVVFSKPNNLYLNIGYINLYLIIILVLCVVFIIGLVLAFSFMI